MGILFCVPTLYSCSGSPRLRWAFLLISWDWCLQRCLDTQIIFWNPWLECLKDRFSPQLISGQVTSSLLVSSLCIAFLRIKRSEAFCWNHPQSWYSWVPSWKKENCVRRWWVDYLDYSNHFTMYLYWVIMLFPLQTIFSKKVKLNNKIKNRMRGYINKVPPWKVTLDVILNSGKSFISHL